MAEVIATGDIAAREEAIATEGEGSVRTAITIAVITTTENMIVVGMTDYRTPRSYSRTPCP